MSEVIHSFNISRAMKYNSKSTYDLFLLKQKDRSSEAFAWEIQALQKEMKFEPWEQDGKFGNQTYLALLALRNPVLADYILYRGNRIPIPISKDYRLVTFDEADGLDLHKFGNFSKRTIEPYAICMHWGGLDPKHCYNVFASGSRSVSSHFLIGLDPDPVVYQVLDLKHRAWHGGWINDDTIGIDVCQSPLRQWKDHYLKKGYDVTDLENPTTRGPKRLITLDPRIAVATDSFVTDLLEALDWDFITPPDHDVRKSITDFTVFGHHHVNERKYDIAPWWDDIFGDFDEDIV
jgi:hypothetical protein